MLLFMSDSEVFEGQIMTPTTQKENRMFPSSVSSGSHVQYEQLVRTLPLRSVMQWLLYVLLSADCLRVNQQSQLKRTRWNSCGTIATLVLYMSCYVSCHCKALLSLIIIIDNWRWCCFLLHLERGLEARFSHSNSLNASWCTLLHRCCCLIVRAKMLPLTGEICQNPGFLDFFKTNYKFIVFFSPIGEKECFLFRGITPAESLPRGPISCSSRKGFSCGISYGLCKADPLQAELPEMDSHFWFCHGQPM